MQKLTMVMEEISNDSEGDFLINVSIEFSGYSVTIEEFSETIYGYLLFNDDIIAHVWLCNNNHTPVEEEWQQGEVLPSCKNSITYCKEYMIDIDISELWVEWLLENGAVTALIYQHNLVVGILKAGFKPGYSYNAKKDGPLALAMEGR